jgi:hypothetical protein
MKCIIYAQLIGAFTKSFVSKSDGKTINYSKITIFNPDFFTDADRYVPLSILSSLFTELNLGDSKVLDTMVGKEFMLLCDAKPDKFGSLKVKVTGMQPVKGKKTVDSSD